MVVLLSGGRDSVCLLDVVVTLCGADRALALHLNYGLRPEAGDDERHCQALCRRLGVELEVVHADRQAHASGNLQAWARELRYHHARRLAEPRGWLVAAGHTATDQVETILYRLAASPGRRALLGMAPRDGSVVRPLLEVTRVQTADHCRARGLGWREDASNESDRYTRARVRHDLVPALRALHPAAEENVLHTAELLRAESAVLEAAATEALRGQDEIALSRLRELGPALARLVVVRLAEDAAGRLAPAAGRRLEELLALGGRGGSAALDLGGGIRAVVEYGVLRMTADPSEPVPGEVALPVPGRARFGLWELDCELAPGGECGEGHDTILDADALGEKLVVRPWRPGDRVAPAGGRGTKTLADLFTDRRVPRAQRRTVPVVETEGAIAWVPGVATDRRFAVTDRTRRTVLLRARPAH